MLSEDDMRRLALLSNGLKLKIQDDRDASQCVVPNTRNTFTIGDKAHRTQSQYKFIQQLCLRS